jgi:hypothetical protein
MIRLAVSATLFALLPVSADAACPLFSICKPPAPKISRPIQKVAVIKRTVEKADDSKIKNLETRVSLLENRLTVSEGTIEALRKSLLVAHTRIERGIK